ncbi:MAG: Rieske 2Fe-2S domain-containing protein [Actinobacteria bacterium]|nr:MAG: Rieske 2Fe-2S domain-containing protein [Actinomycetota bacterium]
MKALWRWLVATIVLVFSRGRRRPQVPRRERIVPPGGASPRAELVVLALLGAATLCAIAFIAIYALDRLSHQTQLLGLALGLALAFIAAACIVTANRLIVTEELEEDYPPPAHPGQVEALDRLVDESGDRISRKRLLTLGAGAAGAALGAALLVPAVSLGPLLDTAALYRTPWRRGRRLVDETGRPFRADEIEEATFYTAYPEGASREEVGSPLLVIRLDPKLLRLPQGRAGWAPQGILAYSKICTHAGCAINLYRSPLFPAAEPKPAFVCPCHYSTFDPTTGGTVIFGPAGRNLPQLPLLVDSGGHLCAGGVFSGAVGPSWWGVRLHGARS